MVSQACLWVHWLMNLHGVSMDLISLPSLCLDHQFYFLITLLLAMVVQSLALALRVSEHPDSAMGTTEFTKVWEEVICDCCVYLQNFVKLRETEAISGTKDSRRDWIWLGNHAKSLFPIVFARKQTQLQANRKRNNTLDNTGTEKEESNSCTQ